MKAALIGAGLIAKQHLACLRELKGVEIVGVCDLSPAMAESAAERFGVPKWFTDSATMLETVRPDVIHVTTPPASHYPLASQALDSGAHVIVEKPATVTHDQLVSLVAKASDRGKVLVEDYNYVFDKSTQAILEKVKSGEFGEVTHVDVFITLDILGPGSGFADPNAPHPLLKLPGGAIADFLTHLASLAHVFVGAHRSAQTVWSRRSAVPGPLPYDEFRALIDAEHGTASIAFSGRIQPDAFWLRVYGTKMQAVANLFETRLTFDRVRGGPKPLRPVLNSREEGNAVKRAAYSSLFRKLSGGPGTYEGLWELLARTYKALESGTEPPVTTRQILDVNRLVDDLKPAASPVENGAPIAGALT